MMEVTPQLIPAEQETDHSKYKPVKRCPVAEAAAERKKDIFDEPEQNSALLGNRGGWKPPTKKRAKVTGEHVHAYIVAGYKKMTVWAPAYF